MTLTTSKQEPVLSENPETGGCLYSIRVYPSSIFQDKYHTDEPWIYATVLGALFLFTSCVFVFYDCMVQRRQNIVMKSAIQSGTLVSSLFPEEVRNQLYKEGEAAANAKEKEKNWLTKSTTGGYGGASEGLTAKQAIANLYPETTIFFMDLAGESFVL